MFLVLPDFVAKNEAETNAPLLRPKKKNLDMKS